MERIKALVKMRKTFDKQCHTTRNNGTLAAGQLKQADVFA
jgi:hypothetical protein